MLVLTKDAGGRVRALSGAPFFVLYFEHAKTLGVVLQEREAEYAIVGLNDFAVGQVAVVRGNLEGEC